MTIRKLWYLVCKNMVNLRMKCLLPMRKKSEAGALERSPAESLERPL